MFVDYAPILLTVAICIFARQIGERLGVVDQPDNLRKTHPEPTPLVGGIAIMVPIVMWSATRIAFGNPHAGALDLAVALCAGGIAVVGFMDDQQMISPVGRLLLLAIFSIVALKLAPQLFVYRIHTVTWGWLSVSPALSMVLVVLALMGFSSAVNMVDGVNGLVLALVCIWSVCLALKGGAGLEMAQLLMVACFVTLLFNARGRLFLGDCGAFAIAFALGLMVIESHNEGRIPLETVLVWFLLPVVDCLRLIPLRILRGRSPFRPDRLHFHHRLGERIGEPGAIVVYVGLVALTSLTATVKPELSGFCVCVDAVFYLGFLLADALAAPARTFEVERPGGANVVALQENRRRGAGLDRL